jgi:hypothetical protein
VLQQTPLAVTCAPPSEVTLPPLMAVVMVMLLIVIVVTTGNLSNVTTGFIVLFSFLQNVMRTGSTGIPIKTGMIR